jgi:hypothetical protein
MSTGWRLIRSLAGTGLLVLIAGCASWQPFDSAQTLHPGRSLPYQLRATRSDGSRTELTAPFVRSDSLYGRVRRDTVSFAVADIARLERSRFSVSRTAGVLVIVPVVGFGVTYLILCGIGNCEAETDILSGFSQ